MRRLLLLTQRTRSATTNRALGLVLAFNAGAVNAGGFMVLGVYTSHMTGFTSQFADNVALANPTLVLNAMGAIGAFVAGAATTAVLVGWARRRHLHSLYALPLLLEAVLLFVFGTVGAAAIHLETWFALSVTVLLLSFIMGLQNAVGSKTTRGSQRTTRMTGNLTDLGIELGKLVHRTGRSEASARAGPDARRLQNVAGLIAMFVVGGVVGAVGFRLVGFVCVIPLAAILLALSVPPFMRDARRARRSGRRDQVV